MRRGLDLHFEFVVPAGAVRLALGAALLAGLSTRLASESVSLATYYPAPSGVYTQMLGTQQAWVAKDPGGYLAVGTAGPLAAGTIMSVNGAAGIGVTAPGDVLEVDAPAGNLGGSYGALIGGSCPGLKFSAGSPALELETGGCPTGGPLGSPVNSLVLRSAGNIQLQGGGGLPVTVTGGGRVGIGTAAPISPLDVNGDVNVAGCAGKYVQTSPAACKPNTEYATWMPGIMSSDQYGTVQADTNVTKFYCCHCPAGGCLP